MRRMTIFRSDAAVLAVLLACALAVPAAAQQPSIPVLTGARARAQDRANQASAQTVRQEQQAQQGEKDKHQMTKEDAERILNALKNDEKENQEMRRPRTATRRVADKDW